MSGIPDPGYLLGRWSAGGLEAGDPGFDVVGGPGLGGAGYGYAPTGGYAADGQTDGPPPANQL